MCCFLKSVSSMFSVKTYIIPSSQCTVCLFDLFFFVSALNIYERDFLVVQLERGLHGLEPLVVANFPTKKYSDQFFSSAEDTQ